MPCPNSYTIQREPNSSTTLFKGRFENKIMKKAYNVDVLQYGIDENSGLFIVKKFSPPLNDQGYYIARFINPMIQANAVTM